MRLGGATINLPESFPQAAVVEGGLGNLAEGAACFSY